MPFAALALLCVLLIGYAAHRASLCNVRAVAEVINTGRAPMLWGLLQAVLWMATLTGVLVLLFGVVPQPATARMPIAWALAGGGLFGLGAAINGGCSLSTLHRLADGELGMLATLAGFVLGVFAWLTIGMGGSMVFTPVASPWLRWPDLAPWLLVALLVWATLRGRSLWQLAKKSGRTSLRDWLIAPAYHVSVAAAVMGLAAGLLYATQGAWSYTNYIRNEVQHTLGDTHAPTAWHGVLLSGLVMGMAISALQRRSLRIRAPEKLAAWLRHSAGGALMGAGAAMIPGGNDTLLLSGLPALTATAVGAYGFMLIGISCGLWAVGRLRRSMKGS